MGFRKLTVCGGEFGTCCIRTSAAGTAVSVKGAAAGLTLALSLKQEEALRERSGGKAAEDGWTIPGRAGARERAWRQGGHGVTGMW